MKGIKKIGLIALSLAFVGVVTTACSKSDDDTTSQTDTTTTATETGGSESSTPSKSKSTLKPLTQTYPVDETDTEYLNSILLDTSCTKTTFYIGEEFTYEGLGVITSTRVTTASGTVKGYNQAYTDDYSVDTDAVDMGTVGTYQVTVTVRVGTRILSKNYNISVKSSMFESTPNLTYNAGLEVSFGDDTTIKRYLLTNTTNSEYTETYDESSLISGLKISLHKKQVSSDAKSVTDLAEETLSTSDVIIENPVNINKKGTYKIKITYKGSNVTIDGEEYSNDVSSFLIVSVENPITNLSVSGQSKFEANIDGIDAEAAGWSVKKTLTVKEDGKLTVTEPFTYDNYTLSGVDIFKWGSYQDVTITLNEDTSISATKSIMISESTTQNIVGYTNLTPAITAVGDDGLPTEIKIAGTDFIYGPLPKTIAIEKSTTPLDSSINTITGDYYTAGATYTAGRANKNKANGNYSTDGYGSVTFDTRITIKGTSQAFKINMASAGDIVVFFASTGAEERDICIYNDADGEIGEVMDTGTTTDTSQQVVRKTFHVDAAGTYYIANPSGGIYVHGFYIATAK